ncbi:spore-associated protein A [Nonomuraea wenchangensis]
MTAFRVLARAAVVTAFGAALVAPALPAAAATPEGICGSGYRVIDQMTDSPWGTYYLLYNGGNGYNCVVAIKSRGAGTKTFTEARIQVQGSSTIHRDSGQFESYAGPVRVYANNKCVQWGGRFSDYTGQTFQTLSGWEHCG